MLLEPIFVTIKLVYLKVTYLERSTVSLELNKTVQFISNSATPNIGSLTSRLFNWIFFRKMSKPIMKEIMIWKGLNP